MFLVCLVLNEVYIACCNTQKKNKEAINGDPTCLTVPNKKNQLK